MATPSLTVPALTVQAIPAISRLSRNRAGTTGLEYALIAAALGLVLISLYSHFGQKLHATFASDVQGPTIENH